MKLNSHLVNKEISVYHCYENQKSYFTSFNETHITESKCFCKTVTPFLSNKVQSSKRRKPSEEDEALITNEEEVAMKLSDFFSDDVVNLKIPKFENFDLSSENTDHPILKATVKYRKHPRIIAIASEFTKECFSFNMIAIEDEFKEISMLGS